MFLYILIATIIIVGILDAYSTNKALSLGLKELNPFMKWLQNTFGSKWVLFKLGLHLSASYGVYYFYLTTPIVPVIAAFAIAINFAVVLNNFKLIRKKLKNRDR